MLIESIKLRNFRNFKKCDIEFSCDPNKNLTIVLGQNTFGKTTLVKAFIWCLYRQNLFVNKILLNNDIANDMYPLNDTETVSVEIRLEHKGYNYKITTKESYKKSSTGTIYTSMKAYTDIMKQSNGQTYPIKQNQVDDEIEEILRSDLREYFFFDGETNTIDKVREKQNLENAVTNILGINKIKEIQKYFQPRYGKISKIFTNQLTSIDENQIELAKDKYDEAVKQKQLCDEDLIENVKEQEELERKIAENERILNDCEQIIELQSKKNRILSDIAESKKRKEANFQNIINGMNNGDALLHLLYAKCFQHYDFEKISKETSFKKATSYRFITEQAVDDLIKNGQCICGAKISNGNDAWRHLIEAKNHMEPSDYGKYISDFIAAEKSNLVTSQSIYDNLYSLSGSTVDLIIDKEKNEKSVKEIEEKIKGQPDVGTIQKFVSQWNITKAQKEATANYIRENRLPEIEKNIDKYLREIRVNTADSKKNDFINTCLDYVKSIYDAAVVSYDKHRQKIHKQLEEEVNEIFKSMYHGNRRIMIDDNFKAKTLIVDDAGGNAQIDSTTGLDTVVNYSFVAGLMKLAKKQIIDDLDMVEEGNETNKYPLVMDAPFSSTDEIHIRNICNTLPTICNQVIMFVMEKDFKYAQLDVTDKIGKLYRLNKISETQSELKEEEL